MEINQGQNGLLKLRLNMDLSYGILKIVKISQKLRMNHGTYVMWEKKVRPIFRNMISH